jgi:hypothetical protein
MGARQDADASGNARRRSTEDGARLLRHPASFPRQDRSRFLEALELAVRRALAQP